MMILLQLSEREYREVKIHFKGRYGLESKRRVVVCFVVCWRYNLLCSPQPKVWQEGEERSGAFVCWRYYPGGILMQVWNNVFASIKNWLSCKIHVLCLQRMHLGVERDADRQRRKEENRRLLEEQVALQKQLEERDRQETVESSVSRWQSTSPVVFKR